jgi:excinuclease ABC subunit A
MVDRIINWSREILQSEKQARFMILAPLVRGRKGEFIKMMEGLRGEGYKWVRVDKKMIDLYADFGIAKTNKHDIEAVADRVVIDKTSLKNEKSLRERLMGSVEQALKMADGLVIVSWVKDPGFVFPEKPEEVEDRLFSENYACPECNISLPELEPRLFSFNTPHGACSECQGLGVKLKVDTSKVPEWKAKRLEERFYNSSSELVRESVLRFMIKEECETCKGSRLSNEALSVKVLTKNIAQVSGWSIEELYEWIKKLKSEVESDKEKEIAEPILREIKSRLKFLLAVGLDYLSLDRQASTLSSGEGQRIRLASQIGTGLTGVLYILDEPTIGLHPRDNQRLIKTLKRLVRLGNTLVVVEHDREVIESGEWITDFGLMAGKEGGKIVASGDLVSFKKNQTSLTAKYLRNKGHREIKEKLPESKGNGKAIKIKGCRQWNLKNVKVEIPLNRLVSITGVSGSGKSTLIHDTLYHGLKRGRNAEYKEMVGEYDKIEGEENLEKIILVDQSPIGRTPRSNPATYTKVFDDIRKLFAQTRDAQIKGYKVGKFSFNVKGGRCDECEGQGFLKIEMQFLPDVYVKCNSCGGKRYKEEILDVEYKDKNIGQVLDMTIKEAIGFFGNISSIRRKLLTLQKVGLDYLQLGQPSPTLSGGESQRLKISRELVKKGEGKTLYILDEPTTGLHFYDVEKLVLVLKELVSKGNTVVVIEHNLELIANSDWVIDLGPGGGDKGGQVVVKGSPEEVADSQKGFTSQYLKDYFQDR